MIKKIFIGLPLLVSILSIPSHISWAGEKEIILMKQSQEAMKQAGLTPVVFPHKAHINSAQKKCETCHEEMFVSKEGANNISHKTIMDGEHCGVCHDQMFIIMCEKCHSYNK